MADYLSYLKNNPNVANPATGSFADYISRDPELARQAIENTSMSDQDYALQHWNLHGQSEGRVAPWGAPGASQSPIFDMPTITPDSGTTTSSAGIDWGSPGVAGLLDQIKNWTSTSSGLAQNATSNIGNFYNNLMRESLGPQAFQGTLNSLRSRNMLNSSVASDALANAQSNIAGDIGNRAFDTYLKGYDTQMQMPNMLAQLANALGGQSTTSTDPMAVYRLLFDNII